MLRFMSETDRSSISAPQYSHLFTVALSLKRPRRMGSCTLQSHADCSVWLRSTVSSRRGSWGSPLTGGIGNDVTTVVKKGGFGHACSVPSARVRSCRSSTASAVKKRKACSEWQVPLLPVHAPTVSVRHVHAYVNVKRTLSLHYQALHGWSA